MKLKIQPTDRMSVQSLLFCLTFSRLRYLSARSVIIYRLEKLEAQKVSKKDPHIYEIIYHLRMIHGNKKYIQGDGEIPVNTPRPVRRI